MDIDHVKVERVLAGLLTIKEGGRIKVAASSIVKDFFFNLNNAEQAAVLRRSQAITTVSTQKRWLEEK